MAFDFLLTVPRPAKPRSRGLTMVLDKGLGLHGAQDLVDTAAAHVDIIKLGWGTSGVMPEAILRQKIQIYRDAGVDVCPGGTFMEVAFDRDEVERFLDSARDLGFSCVEVSNGIHPDIDRESKTRLIQTAVAAGFRVFSEIGRKLPEEDRALTVEDRVEEAKADLAAGAERVILEARESGTVGIFKADGSVDTELACALFQDLSADNVIWEAPRKNQQVWLLRQLGHEVNIGNVATEDAISLETLRRGLRGDTVRDCRPGVPVVSLELGVGGALRAAKRGDIVVVVDALRASSSIIAALGAGAQSVRPVVSIESVSGAVTAGERGGRKLPNADYSNSPLELSSADLQAKELVLSTTNGTECIRAAFGEDNPVLVGSVVNATAVARRLHELREATGKDITLLSAGRNNQPAVEDLAACSLILERFGNAVIRGILDPIPTNNLFTLFVDSPSGQNLAELGAGADIIFCATADQYDFAAIYDGETIASSR